MFAGCVLAFLELKRFKLMIWGKTDITELY